MELRMDSHSDIYQESHTDRPKPAPQPVHHMVLPILGNSHFSATQIKSHWTPLFFHAPHSVGEEILSLSQNMLRIFPCLTIFTVIAKPLFLFLFFFCNNTNSLLRSLPAPIFLFLQSLLIKATRVSLWTSGSREAFLSPKPSSAFTSYSEKR